MNVDSFRIKMRDRDVCNVVVAWMKYRKKIPKSVRIVETRLIRSEPTEPMWLEVDYEDLEVKFNFNGMLPTIPGSKPPPTSSGPSPTPSDGG